MKPKNKSENRKIIGEETWVTNVWRPAMAWSYMAICLFDFIIAPTGTSILITFYKSTVPVWRSLTLENGGIIHVAFGAILGVAAWGRTREAVINTETYGGGPYGGPYGGRGTVYTREDVYVSDRYRQRNSRDNYQDRDRNRINSNELIDNMHEADHETLDRNRRKN